MTKPVRIASIICLFLTVSFISACSAPPTKPKQQVLVFHYPSYPALDYAKPNTCTESVAPYFPDLGIQCRCNNYPDGYGYRTNEPGVTTRCIPPKQWLAQKRQEELLQDQRAREAQQWKLEKDREWERTRPQREAQARYQAEQERIRLNSTCPIYYTARQSCATAAHYSQCMNIRLSNRYSQYDDRACFNR